MAVPNKASRMAAASATERGHSPRMSSMPSAISRAVAVHATSGIRAAGKYEFTSAVY